MEGKLVAIEEGEFADKLIIEVEKGDYDAELHLGAVSVVQNDEIIERRCKG